MAVITPTALAIEGIVCGVSVVLAGISYGAHAARRCHWTVPVIFAIETAEHGLALVLGSRAFLVFEAVSGQPIPVPWVKLIGWMLTCPLLLQAALLLDPWRWRKEVALQASAAEAERLAGTELTTKPAAPANKRSTRVAPHSSLVDSHAAARRPSGGRQEDVALRAAQVAFAQPPRQGRFRLDATACGGRVSVVSLVQAVLVVVMISLSVAAELSKSFAVAVAVVAVSLLCGMAAMALMIMQLQTFRRGSRIEMRPLLTRFIVAIVCSWSMYPVVFVLGPGVRNVIDNATAVAAFAVLDILSKNAFVMWVWSAANRIWAKEKELVEVLGLRLPESSGTGFPPASPEVTRVREAPARSPLGQHERSLV